MQQSTNDEVTDERQVWSRRIQSVLGGGGVKYLAKSLCLTWMCWCMRLATCITTWHSFSLEIQTKSTWQSCGVLLSSSHRFCLLRPPVPKCFLPRVSEIRFFKNSGFSLCPGVVKNSGFSLCQMAMRDDFGQKIRAETPSNGCADPVRIKKSELSVYQMAIAAIVAPSLLSW